MLLSASSTASVILRHCSSSKPHTAASSETVLRTTDRRRGSLAILTRNFSAPPGGRLARRSGVLPLSYLIAAPIANLGLGILYPFCGAGSACSSGQFDVEAALRRHWAIPPCGIAV